MSVKTTITNNSMTSAVVGGKTLTRRTEGGQVIYDGFIDTNNAYETLSQQITALETEITSGGGGGLSWAVVNQKSYPMSIVGSSNISSITDVAKGISEINLSPAFNDANYGIGAIITYEVIFSSFEVKLQQVTASKIRIANHVNSSFEDTIFRVVFGK